jgi:hypothetical protein
MTDGRTFPSYATIAEKADCAASTVAEAIKAQEAAGLMTWDNRIKRVRERCPDLFGPNGWRWRVYRTSNTYRFNDQASEFENRRGTTTPDLKSISEITAAPKKELEGGLTDGMSTILTGIRRKAETTVA